MNVNNIKILSCKFFYHWFNASGTNTEEGFDTWWKLSGKDLAATLQESNDNELKEAIRKLDLMTEQRDSSDRIITGLQVRLEKYEGIGC